MKTEHSMVFTRSILRWAFIGSVVFSMNALASSPGTSESVSATSEQVNLIDHDTIGTDDEPSERARPYAADDNPTRMIYARTAIPRGRRVVDITFHNLGLVDIEGGVHENVSLGMKFIIPTVVYGFTPYIRAGGRLDKNVWLGGDIHAGIAGAFDYWWDDEISFNHVGGSMQVTVAAGPMLFNGFMMAQWMSTKMNISTTQDDEETFWLMVTNLGMSARVGPRVRLTLEYYLPVAPEKDTLAHIWGGIAYGVRFMRNRWTVDISFLCPFAEDIGGLYRYMPIGIPFISFGFILNADTTATSASSGAANAFMSNYLQGLAVH